MTKFSIGADPEVFAHNGKDFIPCIDLLGGDKWHPQPRDWGFIQEDNVMAEFNIDPAYNKQEFINKMLNAVKGVRDELHGFNLNVSNVASARFRPAMLEHPKANMFGCDPDFVVDAVGARRVVPPKRMRFAGGHVHVGSDLITSESARACFVGCLDYTLGIQAGRLDQDDRRLKYYGKLGVYRPKSYGVEYRTPSNFWIFDEDLIGMVYDQVERAFKLLNNNEFAEFSKANRKDLISAFESKNMDVLNDLNKKVSAFI